VVNGDRAVMTFSPTTGYPPTGTVMQRVSCGGETSEATGVYRLITPPVVLRRAEANPDMVVLPMLSSKNEVSIETLELIANDDLIDGELGCQTCALRTGEFAMFPAHLGGGSVRFLVLRRGKQPFITRPMQVPQGGGHGFYALPEVNDEVLVSFSSIDASGLNAAGSATLRPAYNLGDTATHEVIWSGGADSGARNTTGETGAHVRVQPGSLINLISAGDRDFGMPTLGWYGCITCTLARTEAAQIDDATLGGALLPGGAVQFRLTQPGIYTVGSAERPDDQITIEVARSVFLPALTR
jgi:hypothetical protein